MHFIVHALDQDDAWPRRQAVIADHRAYLDTAPAAHGVTVLLSGPLIEEDGDKMIGSFFLLDAPGSDAIRALFADDPLTQADVWDGARINAVSIRQNNMAGS